MTDNELNAMVAEKVIGLRNVRLFRDSAVLVYDGIHTYAIDGNGEETITYQPVPVPDFCNDIAAAWQVLEKLTTIPGWENVSLERVTHDWRRLDNGDGWLCAQWDSFDRARRNGAITAVASTAARAICLAALQAAGVEVEE
jgi:hypothetical protein